MIFTRRGLEFEEQADGDLTSSSLNNRLHPLQFWSPDMLSTCKLEFLHPDMQASMRTDTVTISGPHGNEF